MNEIVMDNPLISSEEVAKILGLDIPTVREWTKDPNCPFGHAIKLQSSWRYIIIRARFEKYLSGEDMICNYIHSVDKDIEEKIEKEHLSERIEYSAKEVEKARISNEKATQNRKTSFENWEMRQYCQSCGLYYTEQDIVGFLAPCMDVLDFCRKGIFKAINPDGHMWFIEKEAFEHLNPGVFPVKCRDRFIKHQKKVLGKYKV